MFSSCWPLVFLAAILFFLQIRVRPTSTRAVSGFLEIQSNARGATQRLPPLVKSSLPHPPAGHTPSYTPPSVAERGRVATPQTARAGEWSASAALTSCVCSPVDADRGGSLGWRT